MKPIYERLLSMWMTALVQTFARSMASAASWECTHCGSRLSAHEKDGTWLFTVESDSRAPSWSRFRHVAAVTLDGKLSISCASRRFVLDDSRPSGDDAGISSSTINQNSEFMRQRVTQVFRSADACGCDLGAGWYCDEHCDGGRTGDHRAPAQVLRDVL